jgi:hypothetical protein
MVFGGARYLSNDKNTVYSEGFERFLTVFGNPSKMGNNCILYGVLTFFDSFQRSKIFLKNKEWMYTLRVFDGF